MKIINLTYFVILIIAGMLFTSCKNNNSSKEAEKTVENENTTLKKVTPENFIRAETDNMFLAMIKNAGKTNKFYHFRQPTLLDKQTVIRMNRDVLYSGGVFDWIQRFKMCHYFQLKAV